MKIIESYLTRSPYWGKNVNPTDSRYRRYQDNGPQGAMLHSVGCDQPSAEVFVNMWNKPWFDAACVHGFIDANTGDVHHTMPWGFRAPHAGGDANNTHIGIEMCEPDCITYTGGSSFTCSNLPRARAQAKRTYDSAVELFADLCKQYGWDPLKRGVIISHKEGCAMGIASSHGDPEHLWKGLGLEYTMDGFRQDVKKAMEVGKFRDVSEDSYYAEAVQWAERNGITKGIGEDIFGPEQLCTRAQAVTFLHRMAGCPESVMNYSPLDDVKPGSYYEEAVNWAYFAGIVKGVDAYHFCPDEPCTRGQIVTFLWRYAGCPKPLNGKKPFIDVEEDKFYAEAVKWAKENAITTGVDREHFCPNHGCTRAQIVTFLYRMSLAI